ELRWPIAAALVTRSEFAQDRVLPLMIWYGIEPAVLGSATNAITLARETKIPKLRRFVARRIFEDLGARPEVADEIVQLLKASTIAAFQAEILSGMQEALAGVKKPKAPVSWPSVGHDLAASPDENVRNLARQLSALFGDPGAIEALRALVLNTSADAASRRDALQFLLQSRAETLTPVLVPLLDNTNLAPDAIRALAAAGDPQTPTLLLERYTTLESEWEKIEIISALASRLTFANSLLEAVHR